MKIDVEKILDLEYLNTLIFELSNKMDSLRNNFVQLYDFDTLGNMNKEDVISLFNQYGVEYKNVLQFVESDFIDTDWEFADLFKDDILHATELKEEKKSRALIELNELNNKISSNNSEYQKEIDDLQKKLDFVVFLVEILNKQEKITESEVETLRLRMIAAFAYEHDGFLISSTITHFLIEKNINLVNENELVDTEMFEKKLDEVYSNIEYDDDIENEISEPVYPETILSYYNFYKDLFDECGLGDNIHSVLEVAHDISQGLNKSLNSIPKIDFCVELASLLYFLNEEYQKEKVNQEKVSNLLFDLDVLDRRYDEDVSLRDFKNKLLEKINRDFSIISLAYTNTSVLEKETYRLNLLRQELLNNLITNRRKEEILEEYKEIKEQIEKVMLIVGQKEKLIKLKDRIIKLLSAKKGQNSNLDESYYLGLTELQVSVLSLLDSFDERAFVEDISLDIEKINEELNKYDSSYENEKVNLQGFVLFDVDELNDVYIVNDLDIKDKNNFVDESMEKNKMSSTFSQYSSLINDLLSYGEPGIIKKNISNSGVDKIIANVYLDPKTKKNPTKMIAIRPHTTSLIRFLGQKFVLTPGTKAFEQVVNILQELLPNIAINTSRPFSIYLNFISSMQRETEEVYRVGISRYNRNSSLYNLLTNISSKDELTEEECEMLKEYIKLTLNAYSELENKNENLSFDIINQIGGKKTRG